MRITILKKAATCANNGLPYCPWIVQPPYVPTR